jgi:hypothetical protein
LCVGESSCRRSPATLRRGGLMARALNWGCCVCGGRVFSWTLLGDAAQIEPPAPEPYAVQWEGNWYQGYCAWCADIREIIEEASLLEGPHAHRVVLLANRLWARQALIREGWRRDITGRPRTRPAYMPP